MTARPTRTVFNCPPDQKRKLTANEAEAIFVFGMDPPPHPLPGSDIIPALTSRLGPNVPGLVSILAGRLALAPDCLFDLRTVLLCGVVCDRPGSAVLWAYGLVQHARATKRAMTVDEWCDLTGEGLPTDEFLHSIWNEQKQFNGAFGNWLDTKEAWAA